MKIRDAHASINNDKTVHTMPSGGLHIIADDGRDLFGISLNKDGTLRIDSGSVCKHGGILLDDRFSISPVATNVFTVRKQEHDP